MLLGHFSMKSRNVVDDMWQNRDTTKKRHKKYERKTNNRPKIRLAE